MKSDEDVKMISAEAPILFAKGCDIFITELTMRAWIHAEESKRRTLQRSDIAQAISKSDMFDFLIDIVPREVAQQHSSMGGGGGGGVGGIAGAQPFDYKRGGDETGHPGASPGQAYPHHPGHPLYEGNRYDPMYYSGQQVDPFEKENN